MSWLNDYVKISITPQELAQNLTGIGFEVEEICNSSGISNVVLGKVVDIQKHPKADRLVVCNIDVGSSLTIVTGATNLTVGDYVPVAKDGAVLPDGKIINTGELRGVVSQGMLCSPEEINMQHQYHDDGILVLGNGDEFFAKLGHILGTDICTVLDLDDYILNVSVPANRTDCHSVYGLAREISVALKKTLIVPSLDFNTTKSKIAMPNINVDFGYCSRYIGQVVTEIKFNKTPDFVVSRLTKLGISVHNSVVDIINYVGIDVGQPMHAFDLVNLTEGVVVRDACQGDKIHALNDKEYSLDSQSCTVVCSGGDSKVLAIAGIIGGKDSATIMTTKNVFLESAVFARKNIRLGSRHIGVRTDSSTRYEKGMSIETAKLGMMRALHLIDKYGIGLVTDKYHDVCVEQPSQQTIVTTIGDIKGILGIDIPIDEIRRILIGLGFGIKVDKDNINITVPLMRTDIDGFADIAEELIRFVGYEKLVPTYKFSKTFGVGSRGVSYENTNDIKHILHQNGFCEIVNFSFVESNDNELIGLKNCMMDNKVVIRNPLSTKQDTMRMQLISGMLRTIQYNINRKNRRISLYEFGKVYSTNGKPLNEKNLAKEDTVLCFAVAHINKLSKYNFDFYDIKAIVRAIVTRLKGSHAVITVEQISSLENIEGVNSTIASLIGGETFNPHASCAVIVDGNCIGVLGDIHPDVLSNFDVDCKVVLAQLDLSSLIETTKTPVQTKQVSKHLPIERDINIVVSGTVPVGKMVDLAKSSSTYNCAVYLQGIYTGSQIPQDTKSVTLKILLHPDVTLKEKDINDEVANIVKILEKNFDGKLRE